MGAPGAARRARAAAEARTRAAPRAPPAASSRPRDAATRSAGLRGHVPSVTEPLHRVCEPRPSSTPTAPPTTASVTQWKSSDTIGQARWRPARRRSATRRPAARAAGRPYSTASQRATPHMSTALATCPDGKRRAVGVEEERAGIARRRAARRVLDRVDRRRSAARRASSTRQQRQPGPAASRPASRPGRPGRAGSWRVRRAG